MDEQSIWKKEISFRRRKPPVRASGPGEGASGEPGGSPAPTDSEPQQSIWKKELSFRRKPAAAPAEQPDETQAEPFAALDLVEAYAAPAEVVPPAAPEPQAKSDPEPTPTSEESDAAATIELFAVPADEPAVPEHDEPTEPTETTETPESAASVAEPLSPALPPAASPISVPASAPVVVHPPVPAAELPPLPKEPAPVRKKKEKKENGDGRVPFYRRELSLGRKPKAEQKPAAAVEKEEKKEKARRGRRSLSLPSLPARGGGKAAKRIVGLKIGASQLSAATVANNGHAEVQQVARTALDPGIVAGGELRDPEGLAEALKEFFSRNKLPKRGVRLGIATNRIGVRTLEIVGVDDPKQLANAIRFRAQEALPIPIDEAVLDYQVLGESTNDEGASVRKILLVLAYRDLVDRYVSACRNAGISLVGIDLEAFALLRALAAPREEGVQPSAALVAVTIGHDRTTFAVSDGRVCEFTRVLDWGGAALNVAVARALDKSPSEVDEIKHQLTLDGSEVPQDLTAEQAQICREALRRQVQTFARELVSSLQFYQNQPGSLGIGEIVITGGTAHLSGFAADLERLIGVRVRVGDPLVRVKLGKRFKEPKQLGSFAVAIGLGIED